MKITGQGLACERGGRLVFTGLDFHVAAGELLVLRGPNGAGKTTLLRLIAGLNEPAAGTLEFSGAAGDGDDNASLVHFVAHNDAIKPHLTVAENLSFWAAFLGAPESGDAVRDAMQAMHLAPLEQFQAQRLSAGQKRRLGLARLALAERPVWLLDEPTVGIDARSQQLLADLMKQHLAGGGLIIASTHVDLPVRSSAVLNFEQAEVS
jgi:heme exporter protein A